MDCIDERLLKEIAFNNELPERTEACLLLKRLPFNQ